MASTLSRTAGEQQCLCWLGWIWPFSLAFEQLWMVFCAWRCDTGCANSCANGMKSHQSLCEVAWAGEVELVCLGRVTWGVMHEVVHSEGPNLATVYLGVLIFLSCQNWELICFSPWSWAAPQSAAGDQWLAAYTRVGAGATALQHLHRWPGWWSTCTLSSFAETQSWDEKLFVAPQLVNSRLGWALECGLLHSGM